MRLLLIRHGETPSNLLRALDTGAPGPGLTDLGHRQAAKLIESLSDEAIGAVFTSNLHRAQLTAAPLARAVGVEALVRDGLREIAAGCLEMRTDAESMLRYVSLLEAWMRGRADEVLDGGEACSSVYSRFNAVVAEAEGLGHPTVAMVSHGAMIRTWCGHHTTNVDADFAARRNLANTGVVVLSGSTPAGWAVETWEGERIG